MDPLVDPLASPPRVLRAIHPAASPAPEVPETGLATPWLFTAGRGSPSLLAELRREAAACDRIDILVSFITVCGVRKLIDVLSAITAANAAGQGRTRIRVLTTTYTGATEIEALDALARLNGCEVRISLDGRRTRLHAKAWIFRARAHFETLWLDDEFTPYAPDDPEQLALMRRVAERGPAYAPASARERVRAQMLTYQVDSGRQPLAAGAMLARFAEHPACAEELGELADVLAARARIDLRAIPGLDDAPLQLHGAYRIREILAAVGYHTETRRTPFQAGVLALHDRRVELLFVTLDKSEGFHDRIAYHDHAVSAERFHWQTQHGAGPNAPAGRRHRESPANGWTFQLFVRVRTADPYRACGPVRVTGADDITGDRPMSITWTLDVPLPPTRFAEFSVLRGQG